VQSISGYLYNQTIDLVIFEDAVPNRENTLVYAKPLQIYKGIDNKIKLLIKNQDQKLRQLIDTTVVFNLISSDNHELVFSRSCIITNEKGAAFVKIEEGDIVDVSAGVYNYSIKLISGESETNVIYADDNYNAQGQARVVDSVYPQFVPSLEPKLGPFYNNNPNKHGYSDGTYVYTDVLEVRDRSKSRYGQQTVQYNATNFNGTVWTEGSLSPTLTAYPTDWFMINDRQFIDYNGSIYDNFDGKFSLIRFKIQTQSGSLNKILYRP
jgi:hypothetical protein